MALSGNGEDCERQHVLREVRTSNGHAHQLQIMRLLRYSWRRIGGRNAQENCGDIGEANYLITFYTILNILLKIKTKSITFFRWELKYQSWI